MKCVGKNQCFEGRCWPSYVVIPSRNDHPLHAECGRTQHSVAKPAPIESFGAWNFIVANAALPEAQAYGLTRHVLSARDPASEIYPSASATRATNAGANRVLPFHPGAARFYREAGIPLAI